ncbi:MAG: DNA polymerase I [Planctomycetota bacterium]|jgi:DNA polymerase-1
MTMPRRRTLYLIDGHAQFFRAYHAIRPGMTSPVTKEPTNLTFGFVGMLLKVLREYRPDYLAVVIDVSGDRESFRSEIYPEYKANRTEAPDDFHPQVERCLQVLGQMEVPVVGEEGVEADDVIATLVRRLRAEDPGLDIRIVSKDKDLTQLLDEHVELFDVHQDRSVTAADIFKTEGVEPRHVIDILTLMGDSIDNVPGVAGIGPKTAAKLVLRYGSVDGLLAHLDEIKGKRRENIEAARDQLPVSRRLIALKEDVEVDFDLESSRCDVARLPVAELRDTFRQLGFNRHENELEALTGETAEAGRASGGPASPAAAGEPGLFDDAGALPGPRDAGAYEAVTTVAALDDVVGRIRSAGAVTVDTETDGLSAMACGLCGVSLAVEPRRAWYVPVRSPAPETHLDAGTVLERLRPVLEDASIAKTGHNLKFDLTVLRRHGVRLAGPLFDTMIASYVIDATRSSHRLDVLALALLGHTCIPITELIGTGRNQKGFDEVPLDRAVDYAAEDADLTLRLREVLGAELDRLGLRRLFEEVEMPLVPVLAELERNGIRVDPDELDRQREQLARRIDALRREIIDGGPPDHGPFNPDSPKQLALVLFNAIDADPPGLGLRPLKRGKTGPSTDQEVLEKLAADATIESDLPRLVLEYRQLTKLVNTYLVALKEAIHPETRRVHASFNQTVAATGRLSASDPNLQNIPVRTDVGREIRRAFCAEPGHVLVSADYSQIELRLLAHLAADPALVEAFHEGQDIHTAVAAEVYGVEPGAVTPQQRGAAKMVNFGIIYGITPYGLARRLGPQVTVEEAAGIIADYKTRFARIDAFLEQCVQEAVTKGYVETILGRRRAIPEAASRHPQRRALGERMAINTVVQGSAADLIKVAMIDLHRRLPARHPSTRMVLQIHDELVFETPRDDAEAVRRFVVERMQSAMDLAVPLVVESAWSETWIDVK